MIEFMSQLPAEYQEVEYIESSGTQYINTGVIPTVDTGVKVRGHFTSVQDSDNIILGASDQTSFDNGKPYSIDPFPDKVYFPFGGIVPDSTDTITTTQTKNKQYEYTLNYMDSGKASVDTLQITLPTRTSMTSNALYLFCLNGNGTAGYYSHFALEYLQITQGTSVIHDYVPCYRKADTVAGLYDIVTGTFLMNAGSGTFAVGNNSNKRGEWVITAGGIIPIQYTLRRRMMSKKPAPQWTLTVAIADAKFTTVSINGESLKTGSYVVDDGTIAHFVAKGGAVNSISLDDVKVGTSSYDLVMHANYTAKSRYYLLESAWDITTQP